MIEQSKPDGEVLPEPIEWEYHVVIGYHDAPLDQEVTDVLNNGGHCVGGVSIATTSRGHLRMAQAVMRRKI